MTTDEGTITVKFPISELSKILYSLKYIIANKDLQDNRDWTKSYEVLASEIKEMLNYYEEKSKLHKTEESQEG
jgi:hypothetical protein|tara:strand:+ start:872 stop:1090 length:219 start_codon:yes stop_codon:yes gene_type:complete